MTDDIWMPPTGTQALIFDCDGTLADTMPLHYVAWHTMLAEHGIEFPEATFYSLGGMPSDAIIRHLSAEQGVAVVDVRAMVVDKEARYIEVLDQVVRIDSVVEIARRHRGVLPMAVASGGERWVVERTLQTIGVYDWFAATVTFEDTDRHKPEPDVFLEAARRLGVEAHACVVFEDSEFGFEAARRAGMVGVDVRPWNRAE
jgi:beta-phosphoglucomutase-like phosphatase (HAD superfamily)